MVEVYTDGSCHTQLKVGAWAAIVFFNGELLTISGTVTETTHNRMELLAVIEAIRFIKINFPVTNQILIVSDSQYVVGLNERRQTLSSANFTSKKGNETRNADLVKILFEYTDVINLRFEKIKAHQKQTGSANYNIDVDKICRKLVRDAVAKLI